MENSISELVEKAADSWDKIKEVRPLVHHITNFVAMSEQAHVTLSIGASPVMAQDAEESAQMCSNADALLLNIGTPSAEQLKAMLLAQDAAIKKGIPILLDPVGYGATEFRNKVVNEILKNNPVSVIKGNYGEIAAIAGIKGAIKGVDSVGTKNIKSNFNDILKSLSNKYKAIIIATGEKDLITDYNRSLSVKGGNYLLTYITGSGCWLGSIIASVLALGGDLFVGCIAGMMALKLASENVKAKNIGSFRTEIFNQLFILKGDDIAKRGDMLSWI